MSDSDLDPDMQAVLGGPVTSSAAADQVQIADPDMAAVLASSIEQANNPPSWADQNIYQPLGRFARNVVEGAVALPVQAGNAGIEAGNLINRYVLPRLGIRTFPHDQLQPIDTGQVLTRLGLPENQTLAQKVLGVAESGLAGAAALPNPAVGYENVPSTSSSLTGAQQSALQEGRSVGMRPTPGQSAGSVPQQQLEAYLESHPWTSGPAQALIARNQTALNRAWASQIGEDSNTVDSTVLAKANDRLGAVFDAVRDSTPRIIDKSTAQSSLDQLDSEYSGLLPNNAKVTDHPLVQQLQKFAEDGSATGEQLGALSSKLGKAAVKQMTSPQGDRDLGMALYQVKDSVDDLVEQGLTPEQAAEYNDARAQYRSLMQLTGRSGNLNPSTGNVNGPSMAAYLQAKDRPGFLFGGNQSPAYRATRFAQAFRPAVGNSGTATRELGITDLWQLPYGLPLNVMSRLYYKTGVPSFGQLGTGLAEASPGVVSAAQDFREGSQ